MGQVPATTTGGHRRDHRKGPDADRVGPARRHERAAHAA